MTLQIPKTASNPAEWVRRAGEAVNSGIKGLAALAKRVVTLEAFQTSAAASLTTLDTRTTNLETFAHTPFTVTSITLTPVALPGSPVKGMTVYDTADDKVKTWTGAAWQAHY